MKSDSKYLVQLTRLQDRVFARSCGLRYVLILFNAEKFSLLLDFFLMVSPQGNLLKAAKNNDLSDSF